MKKLASLRRLQSLMQAKRAAEEARLARHSANIERLKSQDRAAQSNLLGQKSATRNSEGLTLGYAAWADFERERSKERQGRIANARVAQAEQTPVTARAVGASKVVDELVESELASQKLNARRRFST